MAVDIDGCVRYPGIVGVPGDARIRVCRRDIISPQARVHVVALRLDPIIHVATDPVATDIHIHAGSIIVGGDRVAERTRSEEHTSELQSLAYLVCRLLLEKKKKTTSKVPYPSNQT